MTLGDCVCRPAQPCAYHAQLERIKEGCRLGGISLEQRLSAIRYSRLGEQVKEAAIISHELRRQRWIAANQK